MIPDALARAPRIPLPDRSGYWLLLADNERGTACPRCKRAMALAIVHQIIGATGRITTEYSCVPCSSWTGQAAA